MNSEHCTGCFTKNLETFWICIVKYIPKFCQASSYALRFKDEVLSSLKILNETPCTRCPTSTVNDRHYLQSLTKHILQAGLASIKVHFSHAFEYRNEKNLNMYVHCNTFKAIELFRLRFEMSFLINGLNIAKMASI